MRSSLRPKQVNIIILKKKWIQSSSRNEETLKFEISTIDIFLQRQDGQVSNEDPGNEGRRILRGGPAGLNLSNVCNWYTAVPPMEDSLIGLSWRWHSQGMGKYFVTLAKQVGYERTILLLGRHLRFQSIGITMLTIIITKSNRYFFLNDRSNYYNTSPVHIKCPPQGLLPEPWQPPWLLEVHIPKGKTKKTKKKR